MEVAIAELVRGGGTGISPVQRHGVVIPQRTRQAGRSTGHNGLRRNRRGLPGQEHQKHRYGKRATEEIPRPPVKTTYYASLRLFPHTRMAVREVRAWRQPRHGPTAHCIGWCRAQLSTLLPGGPPLPTTRAYRRDAPGERLQPRAIGILCPVGGDRRAVRHDGDGRTAVIVGGERFSMWGLCALAVESKLLPAKTAQIRAARRAPAPQRDRTGVLRRSPSG